MASMCEKSDNQAEIIELYFCNGESTVRAHQRKYHVRRAPFDD